jgi:hypothetical protein
MNANCALPFRLAIQHFSRERKPTQTIVVSSEDFSQETVMTSSRMSDSMSRTTLAVTPGVQTVMWDEAAFASQGPGRWHGDGEPSDPAHDGDPGLRNVSNRHRRRTDRRGAQALETEVLD